MSISPRFCPKSDIGGESHNVIDKVNTPNTIGLEKTFVDQIGFVPMKTISPLSVATPVEGGVCCARSAEKRIGAANG